MAHRKVKYLSQTRDAFLYERRVPEIARTAVGSAKWYIGVGTDFGEAVAEVSRLTKEHDALIAALKDPARSRAIHQQVAEKTASAPAVIPVLRELATQGIDPVPMRLAAPVIPGDDGVVLEPDLGPGGALGTIRKGLRETDAMPSQDDRLVRLRGLLAGFYHAHAVPPSDPDDRDDWEGLRRKIERRLSELEGSEDRLSAVIERTIIARQITKEVANKYRRNVRILIDHVGDVPIQHVTSSQLRRFRDQHQGRIAASSVASMFSAIKSMFSFAVEEELIDVNPMASVVLKREKRALVEIKWQPFDPEEMQRIMHCLDTVWSKPIRNLAEERRLMVVWGIRTLAYSAMRPREFTKLTPDDVTDDYIRVRDSKTKSSSRIIPLHPALSGLPEFIRGGGLDTLQSQNKDRAQTIRHNFSRLIRDVLNPPILDEKKALYSLRSTFSNAMRRAGASPDIRRAILGHSEKGALGHYDDGVEFEIKKKWVNKTNPLKVYTYGGEDDDIGAD